MKNWMSVENWGDSKNKKNCKRIEYFSFDANDTNFDIGKNKNVWILRKIEYSLVRVSFLIAIVCD